MVDSMRLASLYVKAFQINPSIPTNNGRIPIIFPNNDVLTIFAITLILLKSYGLCSHKCPF